MKRIIFSVTILLCSIAYKAQTKWDLNGNSASNGNFIGTTNNEALVLKANNIVGLKVKPNGELVFKSLDLNSSAPSGLVLTSGQGVISRLDFTGSSDKVLFANGTWGLLPSPTWLQSQGDLYYTAGKVGIGTNNPFVQLDVIGDARISNNLYVGGGIVITDKVNATTEVKGWDIKVDNDLSVEASARMKGPTQIDRGFTFDGVNGISKTISGTGNQVFKYGNQNNTPAAIPCALAPNPGLLHQFDGVLQVYDHNFPATSGLLNLQTWVGGSSIDASIGGGNSSAGLLLNYFCGNNTLINTGPNGGIVAMGKHIEMGLVNTSDPLTVLHINAPAGMTTALKITDPAITTGNSTIFEVTKSGHVFIGNRHPNASHSNALLGVDGKAVFTSVYVNQNSWADYVFKPGYQLPALNEVEAFYKRNHHLPEIPTEKEILENGVDVGSMSVLLLKKIEELTLYTVELNKQLQLLKEDNKSLNTQLNNLKH